MKPSKRKRKLTTEREGWLALFYALHLRLNEKRKPEEILRRVSERYPEVVR